MRRLFFALFSILTISVSAQIVEFSEDLFSQYDNKKQEDILNRPIDLDSLYPPFDMFKYYNPYNTHIYPNYIGYHFYIPKNVNTKILSFNSNYDTVSIVDIMPMGIYEVVGIIITNEECEEIKDLVLNSTKLNNITESPDYDVTFKSFCEKYLYSLGNISDINRDIHNNGYVDKENTLLILKGNDKHFYYVHINDWTIFEHALVVEQYEFIKDYLVNNEWVLGNFKNDEENGLRWANTEIEITTDKGLEYNFTDTIGVDVKELAFKDGEYIAIMTIGPDSILYHSRIEWEYFIEQYRRYCWFLEKGKSIYSDTLKFVMFRLTHRRSIYIDETGKMMRRKDITYLQNQLNDITKKSEKYYDMYMNKRNAEYEAAKLAEQKRQQEIKEVEKRKLERKRQQEKESLISAYGERYGTLIFEHKITLGMTKEMCLKAWGKPRHKTIRKILGGTQEVWYYGVAHYLILNNGVVIECAAKS